MREEPRREATTIPGAVYRLQFHRGFTFVDAETIVPYLAALGITHVYASPLFAARVGSSHGYDVVDYSRLNPELGTRDDFDRLTTTLHRHGMGLLLDIAPNHMGIGALENAWMRDVLEWGERSPFASFFDMRPDALAERSQDKLLMPFLDDRVGEVLRKSGLSIGFDRERRLFFFQHHEHRFPLSPHSYAPLLDAIRERLGEGHALWETLTCLQAKAAGLHERVQADALQCRIARVMEDPKHAEAINRCLDEAGRDASLMRRLLSMQRYRLASWAVAADEGNYRRFFDVSDLACMRVESHACFTHMHAFLFSLIENGSVQGIRIDHIDGLFDPAAYCERLRARFQAMNRSVYVVVEKILARHERLRDGWAASGTTGYEFCAAVNGIFIDASLEKGFDRVYRAFTHTHEDFDVIAHACKAAMTEGLFAGDLDAQAERLYKIARSHTASRDYTLRALRARLREIVAAFPVYRTYVSKDGASAQDRREITWAVKLARARSDNSEDPVFDFIASVLTTDAAKQSGYARDEVLAFAMKFQQYTAPVTAKGVEDTAMYRYVRLLSLNEVGSDPRSFGVSTAHFHIKMRERAKRFPHALSTSSTHDVKRGEDVRARLNVLSEDPSEWDRRLSCFARCARRHKREVDGASAPDRVDEYFLYQTLLGSWPLTLTAGDLRTEQAQAYERRIVAYLRKAMREGKRRSSWTRPNTAYEEGVIAFVRGLFGERGNSPFWNAFFAFLEPIARIGMLNGLGQTLLKIVCPGIPDFYQGSELWNFSLVDPDNRGPVDFTIRQEILDALPLRPNARQMRELLETWKDGRVKAATIRIALAVRSARREAFLNAKGYEPLEIVGTHAERAVAFQNAGCVTIVPRLIASLLREGVPFPLGETVWEHTMLVVPETLRGVGFRHVFTGEKILLGEQTPFAEILKNFPIALLVPESEANASSRAGRWV